MRCPTCKEPVSTDERRFRPFCSERCKLIDLGRWLDGSYTVPGEAADEDDLAEAEPDIPERDRHRH